MVGGRPVGIDDTVGDFLEIHLGDGHPRLDKDLALGKVNLWVNNSNFITNH